MIRFQYNDMLSLPFLFVDLHDKPVSLVNANIDIFVSSRLLTSPFHASCHDGLPRSCRVINNSSIVVDIPPKALFPGKVNAEIIIKGMIQADGINPQPVMVKVNPECPVELVDSGFHHHDPFAPMPPHGRPGYNDERHCGNHNHHMHGDHNLNGIPFIKVRLNYVNPNFVRLVTSEQLESMVNDKIKDISICLCPEDAEVASRDDITSILDKFKVNKD